MIRGIFKTKKVELYIERGKDILVSTFIQLMNGNYFPI